MQPKSSLSIIFFLAFCASLSAQTYGYNYQAIVRDASGAIAKNAPVQLRFQILNSANARLYEETHTTTTDQFGKLTRVLGAGTAAYGKFDTLNWAAQRHFLGVAVKVGSTADWADLGKEEMVLSPLIRETGIWRRQADTIRPQNSTNNLVLGNSDPKYRLSVDGASAFGNRIFLGLNETEGGGYSLVHFKNGTAQKGGIIRSSKEDGDDGNAPLLYQASHHIMNGSAIGYPFANGNILGLTTDTGKGVLVFGILNSGGDAFVQSAKVDGPSTLVLNPEGGMVDAPCVRIRGGCDWYETFNAAETIQPGEVVVINPDGTENSVRRSTRAYDPLVAGVVSGAGGINPGIGLSQEGILEGNTKVAFGGRVKVKVAGRVQPGDLLTSSDKPGYAMAAKKRKKSIGAVIGKALSAPDAEGLVLMLVMMR